MKYNELASYDLRRILRLASLPAILVYKLHMPNYTRRNISGIGS
jgi:hypothetical protein